MRHIVPISGNRHATLEQDRAAGGAELRKMHTKTGDIVTVSIALSGSATGTRVTLRFRWGGLSVNRFVGTVKASSRPHALELGWKMIRAEKIAEREGWSWVVPSR